MTYADKLVLVQLEKRLSLCKDKILQASRNMGKAIASKDETLYSDSLASFRYYTDAKYKFLQRIETITAFGGDIYD